MTATYNGSTTDAASTSAALSQTVTLEPTTSALTTSPNPSAAGQTVTETCTVTAGNGTTPTGTVGFYADGMLLENGNVNLNSSGVATFASAFNAGGYSLVCKYGGSTRWGAGTSNTVNQSVSPGFEISVSPALVSVPLGNSGTSTLTPTPINGFNSSIALSASGQPSGVTVGFNPNPIPAPGSGTSTVTLSANGSATPGTYNISVTGTGDGNTYTATITLLVGIGAPKITTVAGNGTAGYSGDGGPATGAELNNPGDTAIDTAGNLYIADSVNCVIRKVNTAGVISTIAGKPGSCGYSGDGGLATSAQLSIAYGGGGALDAAGNLYIADAGNNVIRKVNTGGVISTIAGTPGSCGYSGDGGPATSAQLCSPVHVALDRAGDLYIADQSECRVRMVAASTGMISTAAGNGTCGYSGDGGPATSAELSQIKEVALDAAGNFYIADFTATADRVRVVTASTGIISTVAGDGVCGYSGDGGPATSAELCYPSGVAVDAGGTLYIADMEYSHVRGVSSPSGVITTVAGNGTTGYSGDGGPATSAALNFENDEDIEGDVAVDSAGNLYIADNDNMRIRKVTFPGTVTTLTSSQNPSGSGQPVTFTASTIGDSPTGTVFFTAGGAAISGCSPVALSSGSAACTTSTLSPGTNSILATYSGDAFNDSSTSSTLSQVVNDPDFAISASPTSISVPLGGSGSSTITVSPLYGFNSPVALSASGQPGGVTVTLNPSSIAGGSGTSTMTIAVAATTAVGSYPIAVMGTGGGTSHSTSVTLTVSPASTSTSLTSSPNPSTGGQKVAFTATVTSSAGAAPTGTVTFYNGGTAVGSANLSSGVANLSFAGLYAGTNSVTAKYNGSSVDAGSTSPALSQVVNLEPTTSTLATSPNPSTTSEAVTLTCTVTDSNGSTPEGAAGFHSGSTLLGNANLNTSGVATLNHTFATEGSYSLTCTHGSTTRWAASTSAEVTQTVN